MSQTDDKVRPPVEQKKLYRLPKQGMIAGVVAGLAEYFSMDVTVLRMLFVVLLFATGGFMILVYIIAAIVMPEPGKNNVKGQDIGQRIETLASEARDNGRADRARNWLGAGLVILGSWLFVGVFWPQWLDIGWKVVWPPILIVIGLLFLAKGRK